MLPYVQNKNGLSEMSHSENKKVFFGNSREHYLVRKSEKNGNFLPMESGAQLQ